MLISDEPAVISALSVPRVVGDDRIDPDIAHAASREAMARAFDWFLDPQGADPTDTDGISAGDLAAIEVAVTLLFPAARGVLVGRSLREHAETVGELRCAVPSADGPSNYARVERAQAMGLITELRTAAAMVESTEEANGRLRAKYARTRDLDWLAPAPRRLALHRLAARVASLPRRGRRRDSLLVLEYNPTAAFARDYARTQRRALRLVRAQLMLADLGAVLRGADRVLMAQIPHLGPTEPRTVPVGPLVLAGTEVGHALSTELAEIVGRYVAFAQHAAPKIRRLLEGERVRAVLVPFDTPPFARLVVRVAQQQGIPTMVINDGFKADDIQREGMTADHALAWSSSMARNYFARRVDGATVVGRPGAVGRGCRRETPPTASPRRVLVGSFTFSPIDLNCRRSDAERFTAEVLGAVADALPGAAVTLKLHPADNPDHYEGLGDVDLVTRGDVGALFGAADVYITTYSTSLLDAVATGLPVVYHAVNRQRIGPPFDGDAWLGRRTSHTRAELAALLREPARLAEPPPQGWLDDVLGPEQGATGGMATLAEGAAGVR